MCAEPANDSAARAGLGSAARQAAPAVVHGHAALRRGVRVRCRNVRRAASHRQPQPAQGSAWLFAPCSGTLVCDRAGIWHVEQGWWHRCCAGAPAPSRGESEGLVRGYGRRFGALVRRMSTPRLTENEYRCKPPSDPMQLTPSPGVQLTPRRVKLCRSYVGVPACKKGAPTIVM